MVAIKRGIQKAQEGVPVLLEFIRPRCPTPGPKGREWFEKAAAKGGR